MNQAKVSFGFIPRSYLERIFNLTFKNYLKFAQEILQLKPPLKWIAGATDVEGFRITSKNEGYSGFIGNVVEEKRINDGVKLGECSGQTYARVRTRIGGA